MIEFGPGSLVEVRNRQWVVMPSPEEDLMLLKPLGGSEEEIIGILKDQPFAEDNPKHFEFSPPGPDDLGDFATAKLLYNASRLSFRSGA
ncbi:MAG TPA: hypothetical protein VI583_03360, partial [Cyclobacteriaceae bacterium]|nr:hypothetical protein [Cyclobacteriaceae bacterium]